MSLFYNIFLDIVFIFAPESEKNDYENYRGHGNQLLQTCSEERQEPHTKWKIEL